MAGHAARAVVPILAALAALAAVWFIRARRNGWAFIATAVAMLATAATIFVFLYPHVMVSSTNAAYSLTVQQRLVVVLHAEGHDRGDGDLPADRADLSGLDLLRVSPAHRRRRRARARAEALGTVGAGGSARRAGRSRGRRRVADVP